MASAVSRNDDLQTVSSYLVPTGLAAGLLAAIPGVVDYVGSIPPESSAKQRATKHALTNVTAITLFAAAWWWSRRSRRQAPVLALESLGVAALSIGGWLGGTLVFRNQIGVDHRYAKSGRWQEESRESDNARSLALAAAGLDVNQMKLVHVDGDRIAVARTERGCAAFQDRCTHKGGPLSDGVTINGVVQCPWHGSQFDVYSGEVKCGPAEKTIATYPIEETHVPQRQKA